VPPKNQFGGHRHFHFLFRYRRIEFDCSSRTTEWTRILCSTVRRTGRPTWRATGRTAATSGPRGGRRTPADRAVAFVISGPIGVLRHGRPGPIVRGGHSRGRRTPVTPRNAPALRLRPPSRRRADHTGQSHRRLRRPPSGCRRRATGRGPPEGPRARQGCTRTFGQDCRRPRGGRHRGVSLRRLGPGARRVACRTPDGKQITAPAADRRL
jgi:hypothetical protein